MVPSVRNIESFQSLCSSIRLVTMIKFLRPISYVHSIRSFFFPPVNFSLEQNVFLNRESDSCFFFFQAHINLGKKGYQVPRSGTIQVTLLNPLGTVVKMFVVLYDLSDMPPRSHTFLRQRTLRDKTLRYLVHLRCVSIKFYSFCKF